jgi:uncharacterized membrane protein
MALRSMKERMIQTLAYEAIGLSLSVPIFASSFGSGTAESALLLGLMVVAALAWAPLHNTAFDWVDLQLTGRIACARPHRLRVVHAFSYEISCIFFTLPMFMLLGGLSLTEALLADVGLTLLYVAYAYVFHLAYDRLRPVRAATAIPMDCAVADAVAMFPAVMPARAPVPPSQQPAPDQHGNQQHENRQQVEGDAGEDRQNPSDPAIRGPHRRQVPDQGGVGLGKALVVQLVAQTGMAGHALGFGQPVGLGAQSSG